MNTLALLRKSVENIFCAVALRMRSIDILIFVTVNSWDKTGKTTINISLKHIMCEHHWTEPTANVINDRWIINEMKSIKGKNNWYWHNKLDKRHFCKEVYAWRTWIMANTISLVHFFTQIFFRANVTTSFVHLTNFTATNNSHRVQHNVHCTYTHKNP